MLTTVGVPWHDLLKEVKDLIVKIVGRIVDPLEIDPDTVMAAGFNLDVWMDTDAFLAKLLGTDLRGLARKPNPAGPNKRRIQRLRMAWKNLERRKPGGPPQLDEVRGRRSTARTAAELQKLLYETERLLALNPHDVDVRVLRDQIMAALRSCKQNAAPAAFRNRLLAIIFVAVVIVVILPISRFLRRPASLPSAVHEAELGSVEGVVMSRGHASGGRTLNLRHGQRTAWTASQLRTGRMSFT